MAGTKKLARPYNVRVSEINREYLLELDKHASFALETILNDHRSKGIRSNAWNSEREEAVHEEIRKLEGLTLNAPHSSQMGFTTRIKQAREHISAKFTEYTALLKTGATTLTKANSEIEVVRDLNNNQANSIKALQEVNERLSVENNAIKKEIKEEIVEHDARGKRIVELTEENCKLKSEIIDIAKDQDRVDNEACISAKKVEALQKTNSDLNFNLRDYDDTKLAMIHLKDLKCKWKISAVAATIMALAFLSTTLVCG